MHLRVTTFNANNQIGARAYLERRIAPDIALLQEVARSTWPNAFIPVPTLDGRSRQSATGIDPGVWQLEPLPPNSLGVRSKGTVTAATLIGPADLRFTMVSVYAQINNGLAYPTARAVLDDLEPLLCSGRLSDSCWAETSTPGTSSIGAPATVRRDKSAPSCRP